MSPACICVPKGALSVEASRPQRTSSRTKACCARVHEAIAALRESGMLIAHNDCAPPEVSLA